MILQESQVLSIDAMGGDYAPNMVINGLRLIQNEFPDFSFLLYGDEAKIMPLLQKHQNLLSVCDLKHAPDIIANDLKPSQAIRIGQKSSLWKAVEAVDKGLAGAVVSAGNTGALMAISKLILKTMSGINRPAIAGLLPSTKGTVVVLDLGGNTECDAVNLVQFAIMGEIFARAVLGIEYPKVGLLNIGSEEMKGREEIKAAAKILKESSLDLDFYGFVEGHDIGLGTVDVVVTDGFTGNVALKSIEGTAKLMAKFLKASARKNFISKLGFLLAHSAIKDFKEKTDPRKYNGAMFVGLNGISIKSHGGTDAFGFANALRAAINLMKHDFNKQIKLELENINLNKPIT